MATQADTQPKPVIHTTSSPAKADKQTSEGRDSPHPTDTPVIRREAVIRAASAQSGSSTPRGQSPLTLVSATAGSGSRTASPITHLEEARVHPSANLLEDKYTELMTVVAEMAREVKPAYTGNKGSAEKLKKSIMSARALVKELMTETERYNRQQMITEEQGFVEGI